MEPLIRFLLADYALWTLILALLLGAWLTGVYGFIIHIAFGAFAAQQIGWPNSTFQTDWSVCPSPSLCAAPGTAERPTPFDQRRNPRRSAAWSRGYRIQRYAIFVSTQL